MAIDFLRSRFGVDQGDVSELAHGEWSRAYAFRRRGIAYVARFSALREDFARDAYAARYASPALPIPRVVEIGEAPGGFYTVAERLPGGHLDELDAAGVRAVLAALFAALDAAREVDLSRTAGFGSWDEGRGQDPSWREHLLRALAEDSIRGGRRAAVDSSPLGARAFEEGAAAFGALVERCPEERHLIHADLLHFNVLVVGSRVTGVLDWGCSLYGDFLFDLASLVFWSAWFPAWAGIDVAAEAVAHYRAIGLDVADLDARLRCYALKIGLDGMRYSASKGRWDHLAWTARRTLEFVA